MVIGTNGGFLNSLGKAKLIRMKTILRLGQCSPLRLVWTWVFLITLTTPSFAAFQDGGWGARPVGMGGAYTAISDDSNAPLYNPAGLVQIQWNEVSAMYARLFSGLTLYSGTSTTGNDEAHLDQSYLSYASRATKYGAWSTSWANFNTTSLYREDTFMLSYANYLGGLIPVLDNQVSLGVNLKYLRRAFSLDAASAGDPVFSGGDSASAFAVDTGLLWKPDSGPCDGCRVGLSVKNLNQPDVGFRDTDRIPLEWRLGGAYQSRRLPWLVPALDISRRNGETGVYGGAESWLFNDALGLRAGGNKEEAAMGVSYYQALGKKAGFRLDYGITVPFYVSDTAGSHRFQLTVYF